LLRCPRFPAATSARHYNGRLNLKLFLPGRRRRKRSPQATAPGEDSVVSDLVGIRKRDKGRQTTQRLPRRRRGQSNHTSKGTVAVVRSLARICSDDVIAGALNRNGLRTGRGNRWTRERVTSLRSYHKIPLFREENRDQDGWMNLTESARFLGVSPRTLRLAAERGEIPGEHPLPDGPWVFNRTNLESDKAKLVVDRAQNRSNNPAVPPAGQASLCFPST
jgi:hypothetical protein